MLNTYKEEMYVTIRTEKQSEYKLHMRLKVTVLWDATLCSLLPQISQTIEKLRYSVVWTVSCSTLKRWHDLQSALLRAPRYGEL
jgi:hypothetical protein